MVRSLASHQCGPGLNPRRRRLMWVEFVVSSLLCSESFFFWALWFFPLLETNTSKFQFNLERRDMFKRIPLPPIMGAVLIFFHRFFWLVSIQYHSRKLVWEFSWVYGPYGRFPRCLAVCLMPLDPLTALICALNSPQRCNPGSVCWSNDNLVGKSRINLHQFFTYFSLSLVMKHSFIGTMVLDFTAVSLSALRIDQSSCLLGRRLVCAFTFFYLPCFQVFAFLS